MSTENTTQTFTSSTQTTTPSTTASNLSTHAPPKKESKLRVQDNDTSGLQKIASTDSSPIITDPNPFISRTTPPNNPSNTSTSSSTTIPTTVLPTTAPTTTSSSRATHSSPPSSTSDVRFPELQIALITAYKKTSSLPMPLSGQPFPIQAVSLTINEKSEQEKRERKLRAEIKDNKSGDKTWSSQLQREEAWHRVEKPVEVKAIFTPDKEDEKDKDNSRPKKLTQIKRVLIEGRAGVGKTTLSHYIVWQWAEQGLFRADYDYVLLVPLRQWLTEDITLQTTFTEDFAAFIHERYLPDQTNSARLDALEIILSPDHNTRTLVILDGFDEVAHYLDEPISIAGQLLQAALNFRSVIVTTRDYQLPPANINFDRQLVNIGFTDAQIRDYLKQYMAWVTENNKPSSTPLIPTTSTQTNDENDEKKSEVKTKTPIIPVQHVTTTLQQNPQLWGLAHVPLNLGAADLKRHNFSHLIISPQLFHNF
jgi:hypothetical protein